MRKIKIIECGDVMEILGKGSYYEVLCPFKSSNYRHVNCCTARCAGFHIKGKTVGMRCNFPVEEDYAYCAFTSGDIPIGELKEQQDAD